MLFLLEVHTEKQESKIAGSNQGDTTGYKGKLFDGESGAQLEQGMRGLGIFIWGDTQSSAGQGPELPA